MGTIVRYEACPRCRENSRDTSGDNLAIYSDNGGAFCHACNFVIRSKDGIHPDEDFSKQERIIEEITSIITPEQNQALKEITTTKIDYRGIRKETYAFFGVRHEVNEETGEPSVQYYPITKGGELCGYKSRRLPKTFGAPIGYCGKQADFFGQFRFQKGGRDVLIVGGEIDALSAYQMLRDSQIQRGKGDYEPIAVVSSVTGEQGTVAQAKLQYQFLNKFNRIILALDNDEAGREATEKLIKVLPKGKVYLMEMRHKDPNEYLTKGAEKDFVRDFYDCKQSVPVGIIASSSLYDKLLVSAATPKIPFPPFMQKVNQMLGGGQELRSILNILGISGGGKSTIVNEYIYHMIFHSPYKVGVVSLELDAGKYAEVILSRHLENKISMLETPEAKLEYLQRDDVVAKATDLFINEKNEPRWHLLDERGGDLQAVLDVMEELILSCGCQVIVIDPIQDVVPETNLEAQIQFMQWQKNMTKSHAVSFVNISHVRKSAGSSKQEDKQNRFLTEEDAAGSSSIYKSSAVNLTFQRNKYAEDELTRNTTQLFLGKNRFNGVTGPAGSLYYDNVSHRLFDLDDWLAQNNTGF